MSKVPAFLFNITMQAVERREYQWSDDPAPWTDDDIGTMGNLIRCWQIGRELRNRIVELRTAGKPFDIAEHELRKVAKMCRSYLSDWQPSASQRERLQ